MSTMLRNAAPRTHAVNTSDVDAVGLADDLRAVISGEVRFDDGSRALYSTDGSNYRQVPIGVVVPRDVEDVVATVAACRRYGAPVLPRGGGTSLAGQCCNVAVVMDFTKYMHHILELDPGHKLARVQPGVVLDDLRHAAEKYHLTFPPDPSTHNHCTLGGMIGNNSCGVHSVMGGKTDDNILDLEILTYDGLRMRVGQTSEEELQRIIREGGRRGEIYAALRDLRDRYADEIRRRFPNIPRRVSGYDLPQLLPENGFNIARALVGSEGTCVTVLEATTHLRHSPPCRSLLVLGYPDVYSAADHVPEIMEHGPTGLEGIDDRLVTDIEKKHMHAASLSLFPEGRGFLLVEFGGDSKRESDDKARRVMEILKGKPHAPTMKLYDDPDEEYRVWKIRESGLGATARVPGEPDTWEGFEDSAVHPTREGDYLRDLRKLLDKFGYNCALYGHFGQGCIHTRIDFDLESHEGIAKYRRFMDQATDLVLSYGGSLSGEHGDGQSRAEFLPKMFGEDLVQAFHEFKSIWDPEWKMNPGKIVNPYHIDENLRLGEHYSPPEPITRFAFPEDKGSFPYAVLRCVGVGECRKEHDGTMCPSYMVTREEMHSTRGRARLLFEMLQGDPLRGGWKDEHVREALDLCLACKGCKGECPMQVDMATYKAEFLSHYYEGRARPRHAYAMGLIYWWSRLAAKAPHVANFLTHAPVLGALSKGVAGIAHQREMPAYAPQTFREWFGQREVRNEGRPQVMLWPDCFNNFFHPETAQAGVEVLEAAGFQVIIPERYLCCGRPLYDFGWVDRAQGLLLQILDVIRPQIEDGIPIVGLEPSCVAVFRDEMRGLLPNNRDADRLSRQAFTLAEFLEKQAAGYEPPKLGRKAVVHGHCHHKNVMGTGCEKALLPRIGLDANILDSGCCGMAGSFGFEAGHYDVSMDVGERVLLPAVREAPKDALIVADGFSCRTQIAQSTDRKALHLAQVLQMALREGPAGPAGDYPEAAYTEPPKAPWSRLEIGLVAGAGALLAGGAAWALLRGKRR